ncbi:lysophospholipid acyltransferase family protein [Actinacidiphila acidipaludis]|uniref:1-acyl-sn-glycerol-3-phosphate acyltransferase n=1 Tax=Actinacidiphila acidipaludis TaxID=2873382 RepID=A0ABS7QFD7_9ACTN|nr:lysophospholipid acyltransferase family protein [Streptomyces acidipaludis]MBY8881872.1 1-acyl-sn-glycerol-3-phosphate acyltransferase [Streptomyces acidipaludis]
MSRRRIGFWYRLAAVIAKPPLILLFKRDWRGIENIPAEGGFLTAVNHNSYLDPLVYAHFQYNTGRVPRFLAKASLFTPFLVGPFMRNTGQIPVFRATADAAAAYRAAVEAVNKGECVAFYPEGTLTRDPDLWPMVSKTGIARVAMLTQAPVIPVAQWGANELLAPYAKKMDLWPRKTHKVLAGPPVDLSAYYGKEPTAEVLREVTETIMEAVKDLLAELRGEPAPAGLYDPRQGMRVESPGRGTGKPAAEEAAGASGAAGNGSVAAAGAGAGEGSGEAAEETREGA